MVLQPITIQIPDHLAELVRRRAANAQRTVEQELLTMLTAKLTDEAIASDRIDQKLAVMEQYSDAELWEAARLTASREECARSEELHWKAGSEGLSVAERLESESLAAVFDWRMLIRAKAAATLKERGADISLLLSPAEIA